MPYNCVDASDLRIRVCVYEEIERRLCDASSCHSIEKKEINREIGNPCEVEGRSEALGVFEVLYSAFGQVGSVKRQNVVENGHENLEDPHHDVGVLIPDVHDQGEQNHCWRQEVL